MVNFFFIRNICMYQIGVVVLDRSVMKNTRTQFTLTLNKLHFFKYWIFFQNVNGGCEISFEMKHISINKYVILYFCFSSIYLCFQFLVFGVIVVVFFRKKLVQGFECKISIWPKERKTFLTVLDHFRIEKKIWKCFLFVCCCLIWLVFLSVLNIYYHLWNYFQCQF